MRGVPRMFAVQEPQPWGMVEVDPDQVYTLRPTPHRTNVFATVAYLQDHHGEKVATFTADPHTTVIQPADVFHVQFSNAALYSGEWAGVLRSLLAMGCTFGSVVRMDLAADGLADAGGDFMAPVARSWSGEANYYGKANWRPRIERRTVAGAEFGSRASNKFLRCYRKDRELRQVGRKPWIESHWAAQLGRNPMDTGEAVNRLEVAVKGRELRRYFPWENRVEWVLSLYDRARLVDAFGSMVRTLYDFRTPAARARDAVPVVRWDWSGVLDQGPNFREREPRSMVLTDQQLKRSLKALWQLAHTASAPDIHRQAEQLAASAGPHVAEWYQRRRQVWFAEYVKLCNADPRALDVFARFAALQDPTDADTFAE